MAHPPVVYHRATTATLDRRRRLFIKRNVRRWSLALATVLLGSWLAMQGRAVGPIPDQPPFATLDLDSPRVVDLSHPFDDQTIYWPTAPSTFQLKELAHGKTAAGFFYAANSFCTPEHGGTHLDAPIHFGEGRRSVEQVPLEQLIGPAVVIHVEDKATADPDYRLTVEDLQAWESRHRRIPEGAIVLVRTGWSLRWPDRERYLGDDKPGDASNLHFPSYGPEAARFLIEERRVGALGVDTASIDHGPSRDFPVHRLAAAAEVPGLENVANLEQVPTTGAWVIALPMKIAGGSGAPVRIVALVPREE